MTQRLKCFFGWHFYKYVGYADPDDNYSYYIRCTCGKSKKVRPNG